MPKVTLIATVYRDIEGTGLFLKRMESQTRRPDEIVVCDAGSRDGTWELLKNYEQNGAIPLVAIQEERCRPARGRNLAAVAAKCDILAVTDIGCDWDDEWFEELVSPFESDAHLEAVMGSWKVRWEDQTTPWAKADYVLQNGLELRAAPTSHSANRAIAYRKDFYLGMGGLPEDLTFAADDMTLALLIQKLGRKLSSAPEPRCYWFRPQSLRSLLKEAKRNFRGNGEAGMGMEYFLLVGGRLILEVAGILVLLAGAFIRLPLSIVLFAAAFSGGSLMLRVVRWSRSRQSFQKRGLSVSLIHLATLDYLRRWYALSGYASGLIHGFRHCTSCRRRLRSASIGWA